MNFTPEEVNQLQKNGWDVLTSSTANKNYKRVWKKAEDEFEVETLITAGPDENDYWEFDSAWKSVNDFANLY